MNDRTLGTMSIEEDFQKYHDLMAFRIYNILLVSSIYDSFILERDGLLQERLMTAYQHHNIQYVPRIRQVTTGEKALGTLRKYRSDVIISGTKLPDMSLSNFVRHAKSLYPDVPFVLLAHVTDDLHKLKASQDLSLVDHIFVWTGDSTLLFTIIKLLEDALNVEQDAKQGDVRVIIVVEDLPRYYSSFLPLIYAEILRQNEHLVGGEGLSAFDALVRMRARPKILLASNFEDAVSLFEKYRSNVLGVISDIGFPLNGRVNDEAGFKLAEYIKSVDPHIPVVLQSAEADNEAVAHKKEAHFINKNSPTMLQELRSFIVDYFGFGDFVFRLPSGDEVARASTMKELQDALADIPDASLERHSLHNDFSHWLFARGEFDLAKTIRPVGISDFSTTAELREYLIEAIGQSIKRRQTASIWDFNPKSFDETFSFVKIGSGSMGGKARGLAFINYLLANRELKENFKGVNIGVPKTLIIASDMFDNFLDQNKLAQKALSIKDDRVLLRAFIEAALPRFLIDQLRVFLQSVEMPLAVRSSSLFEDSQDQPFAGIYNTIMLPNNDQWFDTRLTSLCNAVKAVYASTFLNEAKTYFQGSSLRHEEEKMSVIIQELVGQYHDHHFYPNFSGVAQSYNFYPIGHMTPEDGTAQVVLGFGKMAVEGGLTLRFCPKYPRILPQFYSPSELLRNSQKKFYALNLLTRDTDHPLYETLEQLDIRDAEEHGTLAAVGGTYSPHNDRVYDGIFSEGIRVVNFSNILNNDVFPLAEILDYLLKTGTTCFAGPIEMEFAVNLKQKQGELDRFYILQMRPYLAKMGRELIEIGSPERGQLILESNKSLGNGRVRSIRDIVYVIPEAFNQLETVHIASEIGQINASLLATRAPYLLIGIGRWGTSDPSLGIPVHWSQISAADVIVEACLDDFIVEPSCGTHFFHNMTAGKTGYLSIDPRRGTDFIDWAWLASQPAVSSSKFVRHLRLENPIEIVIDGRASRAVALKP